MEHSSGGLGWYRIRPGLKLLVLTGMFLGQGRSYSAIPEGAASASSDPYFEVKVRAAQLVFVGTVVRLLPSPCAPSGLAPSRQGIMFKVRRVLKGDSTLQGRFTAYHSLTGGYPVETKSKGCVELSAKIFEPGRDFIVPCEQDLDTPPNHWVIVGGPWLEDLQAEKRAANAIAKGDIDLPQQAWLGWEIEIERFIQGQDVETDLVLRGVKLFDGLTESQSSQSNKPIGEVSRSALQTDLERWRAWYEKYHQCLVLNGISHDLDLDKACMANRHE